MSTGWERENRTHFDEIVVNYDKTRPEYPKQLFADLFHYAGAAEGKTAIEIGAGTGKATAPVLAAGYDVTAVEIGANMAAFLRHKFAGHEHFRVLVNSFEEAPLEENSCDLIYAASAFHWVDASIGCPKAFRLLKSGGVFALLRYNTPPANDEALYEEIQALYQRHFPKTYRPLRENLNEPAELSKNFGFEDMRSYGFQNVSLKLYDTPIIYSADEYLVLLDTLADHRTMPENDRAALYAGIKSAIAKHGGQHRVDHVFQLYTGKKP